MARITINVIAIVTSVIQKNNKKAQLLRKIFRTSFVLGQNEMSL